MSDLNTALREALNLKKPTQMETIWRCVKEMQPVNYVKISNRVAIKASSVSSLLCVMEKRGMIYSRGGPGKGPNGKCKEYMTDLTDYKLMRAGYVQPKPTPKKVISITLNKDKRTDSPNVQPVSNSDTQPQHTNAFAQVDALTVAQARELWGILNKMFGGK